MLPSSHAAPARGTNTGAGYGVGKVSYSKVLISTSSGRHQDTLWMRIVNGYCHLDLKGFFFFSDFLGQGLTM